MVTLSKVEATLRKATANVGHVVRILSVFLGLLAGVVLLNTAILRTMAERRKLGALRITGMPGRFIAAVALTETTLLNTCGLVLGGVSAVLAAPIAGDWFVAYLPYVPSGDVIELSAETLLWVGAIGTALAAPGYPYPLWFGFSEQQNPTPFERYYDPPGSGKCRQIIRFHPSPDRYQPVGHARRHVLLLGPSGSGKSTLLGLLGGLSKPDRGAWVRLLYPNLGTAPRFVGKRSASFSGLPSD